MTHPLPPPPRFHLSPLNVEQELATQIGRKLSRYVAPRSSSSFDIAGLLNEPEMEAASRPALRRAATKRVRDKVDSGPSVVEWWVVVL